jgi:hypothetical protein
MSVGEIMRANGQKGETAEKVDFISTELGKDLIVSFAIRSGTELDHDVLSLTLLRTPEYEFILDESERGVQVSHELDDDEFDLLKELEIVGRTATVKTTRNSYILDLRAVEEQEIGESTRVLAAMNFDGRFRLKLG